MCSGTTITWKHDYEAGDFGQLCGSAGSVDVKFTATDDCQQPTETSAATFTIEDTTAPNIFTPASNKQVECDGAGNKIELQNWLDTNGGVSGKLHRYLRSHRFIRPKRRIRVDL